MNHNRDFVTALPVNKQAGTVDSEVFDAAIIGGGLAGLTLAISLAKANHRVVLFEKEKYPFHRVCGEYISLESWNFLEHLGVPLSEFDLPIIRKLVVSAPDGTILEHGLPLGGFGISRFKIDQVMAELAISNGVQLMEEAKVTEVLFTGSAFSIQCGGQNYQAKVVCGAFGKRSNLDVRWQRHFVQRKPNKLNNYIGVKYHIKTDAPADTIALHNFSHGYCGVSRIEEGKYCLCYLTTAQNLETCDHLISRMEKEVLQKNPVLRKIFENAEIIYQQPLTISQVSFEQKSLIERHILMVGDASGMITPLCGNGMSIAIHGAKIAAELITGFLSGNISRQQLEADYVNNWNALFKKRLLTGRLIQKFFGREWITNIFIRVIKPFPALISYLIRQTHGEPF